MSDGFRGNPERPPPTFGDWALLAINIVFVAMGLLILPGNRDVGVVTVAFFGTCLAVSATTVLRKLRYRRFTAVSVDVVGGVPIRPRSVTIRLLGPWLLCLGMILVFFGHGYPLVFRVIAGGVAAIGVALIVASLSGLWPAGYLQFDPEGLTIADRGWSAIVAWDDIASVGEGEFQSNPMLLLSVVDVGRIDFRPRESRDRALKAIGRMQAMSGADFAILTTYYGIDLPVLAATVMRYVYDSSARAELRPRLGSSHLASMED